MRQSLFERYGIIFAVIAAVLFPFKLTFGYIGLIPLICLWLISSWPNFKEKLFDESPELRPFILFLTVAAITSLFGINIIRSIQHIGTLFFFPLTIVAFRDLAKKHSQYLIGALITGLAAASFNSLLEGAFINYQSPFLGSVSQSGQITLVFFLALGLYFSSYARSIDILKELKLRDWGIGVTATILSTLFGFSSSLHLSSTLIVTILLALLVCVITAKLAIRNAPRDLHPLHSSLIVSVLIPIITAALLVNLKRGPWVGIFVGTVVFSFLHAKKLLLPLVGAALIAILTLSPVQRRLVQSEAHFFIGGGRNAIWQIGGELALKYPLGIGFENSGFLRNFSQEIPDNLKHFHNNLINVAVETGWLGISLYLYAMLIFIRSAFQTTAKAQQQILISALGCALIAWQVAGLVEYNFGDSSVVSVAYMLIGLLLGLNPSSRSPSLCVNFSLTKTSRSSNAD